MKLTDQILAQPGAQSYYTFEFFPPRTNQGFENLMSRILRLSQLNPLAISVTWGAGGSTKDRSLELAGLTQNNGMNTIIHLTCTNMEMGTIDQVLKAIKGMGIRNILALRGDPPRDEEDWIASDPRFTHAIDLVTHIRSLPDYSSWFCIGVAGYPDGYADNLINEDEEINRLKEKVDAGADFIITQLFYDSDYFLHWYKKVRAKGITVPIIPGIMPIQTYSSFTRITKLCGARIPEELAAKLASISHDDQEVKDFGVKLAVDTITTLKREAGIQGFHFCTLNLEKSVQRVLENLGLTGTPASAPNKLIADLASSDSPPQQEGDKEYLISPSSATSSATLGLSTISMTEGEGGRGELNHAATWDDFPNGRFGDFKSPAFGNQDHWGGYALSMNDALAQWGNPKTIDNLTRLFLDYLQSKTTNTPFSPTPLSEESLMILPHLERLTKKGWWTVGSQPAVDGVPSTDPVVGWGPRAGYIFQKCFVEFFCEFEDVQELEKKVSEKGNNWVHYYACSYEGKCRTNVPDNGRNAVTWGVFAGKEIIQTTIIEQESFLSWKDEAFSIWSEWSTFYHPASGERQLLEGVRDNRWLVNVVHHDYKDPSALWAFLLEE